MMAIIIIIKIKITDCCRTFEKQKKRMWTKKKFSCDLTDKTGKYAKRKKRKLIMKVITLDNYYMIIIKPNKKN